MKTEEKIIGTGAEAILIQKGSSLIKRRIAKGYRIKEIDEKLRKTRTRAEAKIMEKLAGKINVPKIIKIDEKIKEIEMEFINGKKLSDNLDNFPLKQQEAICREIGKEVAKVHDWDLIHGDLTTSNMILVESSQLAQEKMMKVDVANDKLNKTIKPNIDITNMKDNNFKIYLIDFGLGFHSSKIEDKAVDLHLIKQALESKHFKHFQALFKAFLSSYNPKDKVKILSQLEKVELRGRYKH